jgi:hypothetical protein
VQQEVRGGNNGGLNAQTTPPRQLEAHFRSTQPLAAKGGFCHYLYVGKNGEHMRTILVSALAGFTLLTSSASYADNCPASAFKASTAIWKFGDIPTGQTRTARHPCGKQITCVGGKFNNPKILRQCHWD